MWFRVRGVSIALMSYSSVWFGGVITRCSTAEARRDLFVISIALSWFALWKRECLHSGRRILPTPGRRQWSSASVDRVMGSEAGLACYDAACCGRVCTAFPR